MNDEIALDDPRVAHARKMIELSLETAWFKRCGADGLPGEWAVGPELLSVVDDATDVDVYPTWGLERDGKIAAWSSSLPDGPNRRPWWDWRVRVIGNLAEAECEFAEDVLGGRYDDERHYVSVLVPGDHQAKPPIPDELIAVFLLIDVGIRVALPSTAVPAPTGGN